MKIVKFLFVFLNFGLIATDEDCDKEGILIYEDLGCTPTHNSENKCPTKFTCENLGSTDTHCYYKGKSYAIGENVNNSLISPACEAGCFCSNIGRVGFTCAALDCAEWLGVPAKKDCYRTYSLDHCCSIGEKCPPFDDVHKCVVEGTEYKEGQKFSPSNTCLSCVCQKGFDGKFEEPFCKRRICGEQLRESSGDAIRRNCAPFYKKEEKEVLCCPAHWLCPDGNETIEGKANTAETCKFGDKTLNVGQHFERSDFVDAFGRTHKKVRCECVIPPLARCISV